MKSKLIISAAILAVFLIALTIHFSPGVDIVNEKADFEYMITNGEITHLVDGEKIWTFRAGRIEMQQENIYLLNEGVKGDWYENDDISFSLQGEEMIFYEKKDRFELYGSAELLTRKDEILKSDLFIWNQEQEELISPGPVQLIRGDSLLNAEKMRADLSGDIINFENNIEVNIEIK